MNEENLYYRNRRLFVEKVEVERIIRNFGTPLYVYSFSEISNNIRSYQKAFSSQKTLFCYASKANSNLALLSILKDAGWGADIVSAGELYVCRKAGIPAKKIVYSSVGKREDEIISAIRAGILMFNVESENELATINRIAVRMNKKARISLRINPDVDPDTHRHISTGKAEDKFGIDIHDAESIYKKADMLKGIDIIGCQMHIGSQITKISPFVKAAKKLVSLVRKLKSNGINITYLDIGGGLGITYKNEKPPEPAQLAGKILPLIRDLDVTLILEPGRSIMGNSGILLTKVLYLKRKNKHRFIIVDAAMNDLARPSLYEAHHQIIPCIKKSGKMEIVDVVGPVCESGDYLARKRSMPVMEANDHLCVKSAGAYCFSMSSNYNLRLRPAEVLVKGGKFYLIRERESLRDLLSHQRMIKI